MAFFWFLIVLLLLVLLARRKAPPAADDHYAQGYWDGFRAAGDRIAPLLEQEAIDRQALRAIVDEGNGTTAQAEREPVAEHMSAPATVTPVVAAEPVLSPAQQSLRDMNTLLYMGSFLLVAAAAAFVATSMSATVRLVGLIVVTVLFYSVGLVLHDRVRRLRPAAIAFVGTGLAILPFVGVALHLLGGVSSAVSWLAVSVVGVAAYAVATVRLQSQVVSYLTMAFVLSLVSSAVATASLPIVGYFVALIVLSLAAALFSYVRPQMVPAIFRQPIEQTGQLVTPLAGLASLFVGNRMTLHMYELLFGVMAAHYLVVWLQQRRYWQIAVARGLIHLTVIVVAWDAVDGVAAQFAGWWLAIAALQAMISLTYVRLADAVSSRREHMWLILMAVMIAAGSELWLAASYAALGVTVSVVTLGCIALAAFARFRHIAWAYVAVAVSLILPFTIGRWLAQPLWSWPVLGGIFSVAAVLALAVLWRSRGRRSGAVVQLLSVATVLYLTMAIMSGCLAHDNVVAGWSLAIAAVVLTSLSYLVGEYAIEAVAAVLAVIAIFLWVYQTSLPTVWLWTVALLTSVAVLAVGAVIHQLRHEAPRRTLLMALGMVMTAGLMSNITRGDQTVLIVSVIALLVATLTSLILRRLATHATQVVRYLLTAGYIVYAILAWYLSMTLPAGWQVLTLVGGVSVFWLGSYLERVPWLTIIGNVLVVILVARLWDWLQLDATWMIFGVAWLSAGLLYSAYWLMVERSDTWRQWGCVISVWVILVIASILQFGYVMTAHQVAAAVTIMVIGATMFVQGYVARRDGLAEAALYVGTFGAQRIVGIAMPETTIALYAHWWAALLALIAWWRGPGRRLTRIVIATALITAGVGGMALTVGGGYRLLFLVEHIALLIAGVHYRRQWAIWWGVAASVLAVLYYLAAFLYLWLAFLGLVLLAIVIWRLTRPGADRHS